MVPPGIVKRILKGAFVDMAELLKDNLEMERRRSLVENGAMPPFQARHSRREIPDVLSWLHCFTLYAAVVCSKYPNKVKGLLAYQAFIISEARRGGRGWLMYDGAFRQQIQSLEATDFARVNQSLYSTTCLAFGNRGRVCPTCLMADHDPEDCALHPSKSLPLLGVRETSSRPREERSPHRGMREAVARPRDDRRQFGDLPPKKRRRRSCFNYNGPRGCSFSNCQWEHRCSRCKGDHSRLDCPVDVPSQRGIKK